MPKTLHLTDEQAAHLDELLAASQALLADIHAVQNRDDDDTSIVGDDSQAWWEQADTQGHTLHGEFAALLAEVTPPSEPVQERLEHKP